MPIQQYTVENFFLSQDEKVVRIELRFDNGTKYPTSSEWFNNKTPCYSNSNKPFALNVFDNNNFYDYKQCYRYIDGHNAIAIDTHNIYQIDFDKVDDITRDKLIDIGIPYFESYSKKLPHFVFRDTNLKDPKNGRKPPNTFDFTTSSGGEGEILTGQWSYAQPDAIMYNVSEDKKIIDFDIIGSGLFNIKIKQTIEKEKKPTINKMNEVTKLSIDCSNNNLTAIAECIDIEKRLNTKGCYSDYRNIVWALASENQYELAKSLCMRGTDLYDENDFEKTYNSFMKDAGITMGSFYRLCKIDNPTLYNSLIKKKETTSVLISEITQHDDKAQALFNHFGEYFVFMNGIIYFWSDDHKKWFIDGKDLLHTKKFLTSKLRRWGEDEIATTVKYVEKQDGKGNEISKQWLFLQECIKSNKQVPEIKNIVEKFKEYLNYRGDDFKMNDKPYLLAFKNTVYDFETRLFREQRKDDYITMSCGYDWIQPTNEQMDLITLLIEQIFVNEDIRKCYMSILRNGCIGICPEKFVIANGGGRNGKGLLNDLMRCALGDYAYEGNCNTLTDKIKEGANPEVANFHKKRLITFAEPDVKFPINTATLKKLSGGGEINARQLYSGDTKTVLVANIILEANEKPDLNGTDSDSVALRERIRDVLFESSFTAKNDDEVDEDNLIFKQNPYYKTTEFQHNYRCALLKYIQDYEGIDEIYTPDCVDKRSANYLLGNDKIYGFVSDNIVSEPDSWVKVSDLYKLFKIDDSYINMNKSDKRKYNLTYFTECIQKHSQFRRHFKDDYRIDNNTRVRSVLFNFSLKESDMSDPECT